MAIQVQLRRGTATQNNAFTGAIGELVFDTTNKQLRIHDGSQAGGFKIGTGDFPTGTANVALGNTALDSLDGSSPGGNNVAVGHNALTANTTASNNVAVGSGALATSTTATDNTAVGFQALNANTSGADNVAVGDEAGHDITTGSRNTIIGSKAGDAATTTDDTTLVGYGAGGGAIMTGHDNVAVGANALAAATSGQQNTAIGKSAGTSISTGNYNTLLGFQAGDALSTGSSNVAIGYNALSAEDGNGSNVAIGANSLGNQNAGADAYNVAIGHDAGSAATTGTKNTLIGALAGDALTTGGQNVVLGYHAMGNATTADLSTVVGYQAGESITTGARNNLFGVNAGQSLTTGASNTFIGGASTGSGNGAGKAVTTGSKNTILGTYDGNQNSLDIRTSDNYIVLSDGDGNPRVWINDSGGFNATSTSGGNEGNSGHWHEFSHNNNDTQMMIMKEWNTSFLSALLDLRCARSASSVYHLLHMRSGGTADTEFVFKGDGNGFCDGSFSGGGADYAEYFEWSDGNSDNQDRTGYTVVLDNEKIRLATSDDSAANIIGAVSVNPSMVGDSDIDRWKQKYLRNDFGSYQKETYTVTEWTETVKENTDAVLDEDGNVITPASPEKTREVFHNYETDKIPDDVTVPDNATVSTKDANGNTFERRKLNPDYNPDTAYVSREDRQEWATIGLMGKLRILKGQPTGDRWIKMRDVSDTVEEWLVR